MTPADAATLAEKIRTSWPQSKLSAEVWIEELAPLDAGRAGTTLARLRRENEHSPSIAGFFAEYRRVNTQGRVRDPFNTECEHCDDSGWLDATRPQDKASSSKPCSCKAGQEVAQAYRNILASGGRS